MKAAVYEGNRSFAIREIPTPEPGPGQVLVRVRYSAICGSDVHDYLEDVVRPGTILGHEFSGTIAALGPAVTRWRLGDRVVGGGGTPPTGEPLTSRYISRNPRFNIRTDDLERPPGAYAEFKLMEEWEPLPIPDDVPDEVAALTEPVAVAVHAVRRSSLQLSDSVAVLGAGPIGLCTLQVARAAGARKVFVSEPSPDRRKAALEVGATVVFDPAREDVTARIVEQTDGRGPDVAFECAGGRDTLQQSLELVRYRGQVVLIAIPSGSVPVAPVDWMAREVELKASLGIRPVDWQAALELLQRGAVNVAPLLEGTSYLSLEALPKAFERLANPSSDVQLVVAFQRAAASG